MHPRELFSQAFHWVQLTQQKQLLDIFSNLGFRNSAVIYIKSILS